MYGITLRTRAFNNVLATHVHAVDADGTVRVFDTIAGYYTSCHSLSARDVGRVRAEAARIIDDAEIKALADEASQAGDASMVATCRKALRGNVFARACCAGAIDTDALPRVGGQRA